MDQRIYLDETGARLNMTLPYGRSRQGERVVDAQPVSPGETVSTVAGLTEQGLVGQFCYRGEWTATRFIAYLDVYLVPLLLTGSKVLILDRHPVHRATAVQAFLANHRISYIYLPPYSPELNPIEELWSKGKQFLKRQKARTLDRLFKSENAVTMRLGMIGLGRMGANMVRRLIKGGHECVVYDVHAKAVEELVDQGAVGADSHGDLVSRLSKPRTVWLMVPAAVVDQELEALVPLLEAGDIVIDGGNSYYRDDIRRGAELKPRGIHYVDVGTSGGVAGLERGYCLMIGGEKEIVRHLAPIFATLAPGVAAAPRTPGRQKCGGTAEQGFLHCGPQGAGHFVKMVHNGIEYGLMAAYAEGLNLLRNAGAGKRPRAADAETTPMRNPKYYPYELDLPEITEVWRLGSVIGSWLLDLTAIALLDDPDLKNYAGRVSDSGEGRWTIAAAIDEGVPVPVISAVLFGRFESRGDADYADRLLSAMRKQFGGHDEKKGGS